jgi:hypothetical protein
MVPQILRGISERCGSDKSMYKFGDTDFECELGNQLSYLGLFVVLLSP